MVWCHKSSKIGTIRRASEAGVFENVTTTEGDVVSGIASGKSNRPKTKQVGLMIF